MYVCLCMYVDVHMYVYGRELLNRYMGLFIAVSAHDSIAFPGV